MRIGWKTGASVIEHLPHKEFYKYVARYRGDRYSKNFSCWDQYLAMAFAQLTYRESLRDIEACLRSMQGKLENPGVSFIEQTARGLSCQTAFQRTSIGA